MFKYDFAKEKTNVYFGKSENVNGLTFSDYVSEKGTIPI